MYSKLGSGGVPARAEGAVDSEMMRMVRGGGIGSQSPKYRGKGLSGANVGHAGDHNQRVILQAVRVNAPITKPDLGVITGLTAPTVATNVRRLLAAGLLREVGLVQGSRGQPAMRYDVNPDGLMSVGINVDRDHLTLVMINFVGSVLHRMTMEVDFATPDVVSGFVETQLAELERSGTLAPEKLTGIGVAIPDDLGQLKLLNKPEHYESWSTVDLKSLIRRDRRVQVYVSNDATAAAIGEMQFGHGLINQNFCYILISSLMGSGLIVEGRAIAGASGRSGEIGYLPIQTPEGAATLQDIVSLSGLYALLQVAGYSAATPDDIQKLKGEARKVCYKWCDKSGDLLVKPLTVINAALNPSAFYIGGRLPAFLIDRLAARISSKMAQEFSNAPELPPVERAALASDAAAMGAATLPFSDQFLPAHSALLRIGR